MEIRKKKSDNEHSSSPSHSRFKSMSWLYRDGLSNVAPGQPVKKSLDQPHNRTQPVQKNITANPSQDKKPLAKKPKSQNDRFSSMSWLYRDNLSSEKEYGTPKESIVAEKTRNKQKMAKRADETETENKPNQPKSIMGVGAIPKKESSGEEKQQSNTEASGNDESYESMRWLYDDEASFQKAIAKLKFEQATEAKKKELKREARKARVNKVKVICATGFGWCRAVIKKHPQKAGLALGACAALAIVVFGTLRVISSGGQEPSVVAGANTVKQKAPEFDTVLPGNNIKQVDTPIAYDEQRKVANYVDTIDSKKIIVSQQQLPDRFKVNQAVELEKFAKEINCSQLIQAGDTRAYLGASIQGPQTVVFIKNNLLVFMKSDTTVSNAAWMTYIESLS